MHRAVTTPSRVKSTARRSSSQRQKAPTRRPVVSLRRQVSTSHTAVKRSITYKSGLGSPADHHNQIHQSTNGQQQGSPQGGIFGGLNLQQAHEKDTEFLKNPMSTELNGRMWEGMENLQKMRPSKLSLEKKTLKRDRIDLSPLEIFPYLENLKGAIVHHDLEQVLASIAGIIKFGDRPDLFGPKDDDMTMMEKIKNNNTKHHEQYQILLDNVKAIAEVIAYDLEVVSELLNKNATIADRLHCTVNTFQHLLNVYHIVPIPLNHEDLQTEDCDLDIIATKLVERSELLDIANNGLDVYKERNNHPPIKVISPLLGAIYMLVLKRFGYTSGLVHTPTVGLVFATPPLSRKKNNLMVDNPSIYARLAQGSPYWYIKNLITHHAQQYRKTTLKLTPVDCSGFCTPVFGEKGADGSSVSLQPKKMLQDLATDFTCSCLSRADESGGGGYGGNFIYIDFLVNRVGQVPFHYKPDTKAQALTSQAIDLSSDTKHSLQEAYNWSLPYPIYSYKTLAMRLIYEPIFARDMTHQLGHALELSAQHLSSHIDDDPHVPKILKVEYQNVQLSSDDEDAMLSDDEDFAQFLKAHEKELPG